MWLQRLRPRRQPRQLALAYRREGGDLYVHGHVDTANWRVMGQLTTLTPTADEADVGAAVTDALDSHRYEKDREASRSEMDANERRLLGAAGVSHIKDFTRFATCVMIERMGDEISVRPVPLTQGRNVAPSAKTLREPNPRELGRAVLEALGATRHRQ